MDIADSYVGLRELKTVPLISKYQKNFWKFGRKLGTVCLINIPRRYYYLY